MRWGGFKSLDRYLCLARPSHSPQFNGRAADAILSRVFLVASALTPRTHTRGVPFARWRATVHTLCLPGPPLGGSEGIGFPEQGDGNPLYTRMEILTLQKGSGSCKAHDPFFLRNAPLSGQRELCCFEGREGGCRGAYVRQNLQKGTPRVCVRGVMRYHLISGKISKKASPVCVCGGL